MLSKVTPPEGKETPLGPQFGLDFTSIRPLLQPYFVPICPLGCRHPGKCLASHQPHHIRLREDRSGDHLLPLPMGRSRGAPGVVSAGLAVRGRGGGGGVGVDGNTVLTLF